MPKNSNNQVQVINQNEQVNNQLIPLNLNKIEVEALISNEQRLLARLKTNTNQQSKQRIITDTVENLSTVLLQALQTKDSQLIYFTLQKNDETLVKNTVRSLQSAKITLLLQYLGQAILKKPYNAHFYTVWLKYLLKYHSTLLINKSCFAQIQTLRTVLQNRTKHLTTLRRLRARMDFTLHNQAETRMSEERIPKYAYVETNEDELIEQQLL